MVAIDNTDDLNGKAPGIENKGPVTKEAGVQTTKETSTIANRLLDPALDYLESLPFFRGGP